MNEMTYNKTRKNSSLIVGQYESDGKYGIWIDDIIIDADTDRLTFETFFCTNEDLIPVTNFLHTLDEMQIKRNLGVLVAALVYEWNLSINLNVLWKL